MNDSASSAFSDISTVHHSIRGRARISVKALYRNHALAESLEHNLVEFSDIYQAQANPLTGKVLVLFADTLELDTLLQRIAQCLHLKPAQPEPHTSEENPPASFIKPVINLPQLLDAFMGMLSASTRQDEKIKTAESEIPWHTMSIEQIADGFEVSLSAGPSSVQVEQLISQYGANILEKIKRRSDAEILVNQFVSLPVGLLGVSAVVSVMTGGIIDAFAILSVVGINATIGFVTERQSEKTISSLSDTTTQQARVLRNNLEQFIDASDIVPGDVLILTPGSKVAADARLIKSRHLSVDESSLTGESLPVPKDSEAIHELDTPLAERHNMVHMGTLVTGGNAQAMVVATAYASQLGQIQSMVGSVVAPQTPLQRQLDTMSTQLALLSGAICAGVFAIGLMRGYSGLQMLKASISLAVAAVPEGLPAVATTTLALGIRDMRRQHVAVRHIDAVETLGSVQVLCLDKTGTLTHNRMTVIECYSGQASIQVTNDALLVNNNAIQLEQQAALLKLFRVACLCNESSPISENSEIILDGSPTENALLEMAMNQGVDISHLRQQYPRLRTHHRSEARPWMTTLHRVDAHKKLLAVKGRPDAVLERCTYIQHDGVIEPLDETQRNDILRANERMSGNALRVLGYACKEIEGDDPTISKDLVWLGLTGMADPLREGMVELMAKYHDAGIETIMITGDQTGTAYSIGKQLNLSNGRPLKVLESSALHNLEPELLSALAKNVHVFARVSPAHKLEIVQALQQAGYVVAMTGDGINDGPALKAANIGIAMGKSGTDIARSVADVVLEDDNLDTMVTAVREGRTIYNNIRKTIHFLLSTNLTEIELMLAGILFGMGQPLNPMQLLWINLVSDIFPGLALSLEPPEADVMQQPPRDPHEKLFTENDGLRMGFESLTITGGAIAAYLYGLRRYGQGAQASTLAFTTLTLSELIHALSCRSQHETLLSLRQRPPNKHLNRALTGTLGAQLFASFVPGMRRLLGTTPLGISDWLVVLGDIGSALFINETSKALKPPGSQAAVLYSTENEGSTEHD